MLDNNNFIKRIASPLNAKVPDGSKRKPVAINGQIRKPYYCPRLEELGDIRALTFGTFDGTYDSLGTSSWDPNEIP